jgi:hypothetical protein
MASAQRARWRGSLLVVRDEQDAPVVSGDLCVGSATDTESSTGAMERSGYLPHAMVQRGLMGTLLENVLLSIQGNPDGLGNPNSRSLVGNETRVGSSTASRRGGASKDASKREN